MALYLYDGTLEGFMTAAAEALRRRDDSAAFTTPELPPTLGETVPVETSPEVADRLAALVAGKTSPGFLRDLRLAFLSGGMRVGDLIYRYLLAGRSAGSGAAAFLTHPDILAVAVLARKVSREAHRIKGFVRFREIEGGFWYAGIETEAYVLPLLGDFFSDRFRVMDWIIHDVRRGRALVHRRGEPRAAETALDLAAPPRDTAAETEAVELWRSFFMVAAVPERPNPALQRAKVPSRYRRLLTEFSDPPPFR